MIKGKLVNLHPFTREDCHQFYQKYIPNSQMTEQAFIYNSEKIDRFYSNKTSEKNRMIFGVFREEEVVGEIQLKYIDFDNLEGTLSIILRDDSVKGKGYGTEAGMLLIEYAFKHLKFNKILADTTMRNIRSKHILMKLGFIHLEDKDEMSYFVLDKRAFHCI